MERVTLKDGKLSQKATRMRDACIGCPKFNKQIPKRSKNKWLFVCDCGLRLTFSGYSNYNQYLNHVKGCPVKENGNEYKTI